MELQVRESKRNSNRPTFLREALDNMYSYVSLSTRDSPLKGLTLIS